MHRIFLSLIAIIFSFSADAKKTPAPTFRAENIQRVKIKDSIFNKRKASAKKGKKEIPRKVAGAMTFTAADVEEDVKKLGEQWSAAKTVDQLDAVMIDAIKEAPKKSHSYQILAGIFEINRKMRGMIWRMRPMFEKTIGEGGNFNGNSMTHISAIQMLRLISTGIVDYLPNEQVGTYFDYINIPRKDMEPNTHQFRQVSQFQEFLVNEMAPVLHKNALMLTKLFDANPMDIYVYDNQWTFGVNSFPDSAKRYSGIGEGEINLMISSLYKTIHDFYIFSSRNQDALINVVGKLGEGVGIDAFGLKRVFSNSELGLTDRERKQIIASAMSKDQFLRLHPKGKPLTQGAYDALVSSVAHYNHAYNYYQSLPEGQRRAMPKELKKNNARAIGNMVKVVEGRTEVREPLTAKTVTVDIRPFYSNPPTSMMGFLPTGFEGGDREVTLKSKKGNSLVYRNYNFGRSISWNNSQWQTYFPSAKGKGADYMMEAKRVMTASGGVIPVFPLANMFVH